DPGTSVLTVTSLGMARRSRVRGKPEDPTAVSWKDEETGWEPVRMEEDGAVLLTLNAEWREEYTADGRSDHASAAQFVLQGARCINGSERALREPVTPGARDMQLRTADDVRELTVFCYLVDAALDAPIDVCKKLCQWALLKDSRVTPHSFQALPSLMGRIQRSLDRTAVQGQELQQWPRRSYEDAVALVRGLLLAVDGASRGGGKMSADDDITAPGEYTPYAPPIRRWRAILELVTKLLAQKDAARNRTTKLAYFSVLWAVHSRLMFIKRKLRPGEFPDDSKLYVEVRGLLRVIEDLIRDYSMVLPWELKRRDRHN
ncbi:MAG TPA: hypothetical protein VGO40_13640, partial [Longimicrobium sp.]|nr:hypothetical protein [Longimicrobium sp.]